MHVPPRYACDQSLQSSVDTPVYAVPLEERSVDYATVPTNPATNEAHYATALTSPYETTSVSDYGPPLTTADVTYGQPSTGEQAEYDVLEQPSVVGVVLERPYEVEVPDFVHHGMDRKAAEAVRSHVCCQPPTVGGCALVLSLLGAVLVLIRVNV